LVLTAGLPDLTAAQSGWAPAREVRLLNGFPVGGSADVLCRILAEALRPIFGQTVIVDSKTGANGFIAAEIVARAPPDGHTVCFVTMGMLTIAPQMPGFSLPINPSDLTPIANIGGIPSILVAYPEAPFRTVPELIAYAKANPGKVAYASSGPGSVTHLSSELFRTMAGIEILNVPYRGGGPAIIDLISGRVQMMIGNMPDFVSQIKGGKLRALAFGGSRPAPQFPDLPLIKQWLPDFDVDSWFGLTGPPGLPAPIQTAWNTALQRVYADPAVQRLLSDNGFQIMIGPVERFKSEIAASTKRWGEVIRSANIKSE
jgi:tripartite-type tricarboxylate transporter receptor subunit TctC